MFPVIVKKENLLITLNQRMSHNILYSKNMPQRICNSFAMIPICFWKRHPAKIFYRKLPFHTKYLVHHLSTKINQRLNPTRKCLFAAAPTYAYLIPTIPYSCPIPALSDNIRIPHPDTFSHIHTSDKKIRPLVRDQSFQSKDMIFDIYFFNLLHDFFPISFAIL